MDLQFFDLSVNKTVEKLLNKIYKICFESKEWVDIMN